MIIKNIIFPLLSILSAFIIGCSSMTTRGKLDPISFPQSSSKSGTVTFRFYEFHENTAFDDMAVSENKDKEEILRKILDQSGLFSEVISFDRKSFYHGRYSSEENDGLLTKEELIGRIENELQVKWPVKTDYFLDIKSEHYQHDIHSPYMHIGFFHILSLGFIPFWMPQYINYKVTLYNKNGDIVFRDNLTNEYSVWAWTPLFFFNGFHLLRPLPIVTLEKDEVSLQNAVKNISVQLSK